MLKSAIVFLKSSITLSAHRLLPALSFSTSRLVLNPPDLAQWVRTEGGFVHTELRIASHGCKGLGVYSFGVIPAGSDLIILPSHIPLGLQHELGGRDSVLIQLSRKIPEELWAMRLGLRLLQERATIDSFWTPYTSNLPETYNVPIFFSGEEIKSLHYAPIVYQVNKRCSFLLKFEKEIENFLSSVEPKHHPFGDQVVKASSLGWAMSAVSSRAFCLHGEVLPDGRKAKTRVLLPLIDMCNHSFQPNAKIVQMKEDGSSKISVKVVSETRIDQGSPILLNYGCLSNDLFFLDYGFVVPSNQFDHIELKYDGAILEAAAMASGISSPSFSSPTSWQQEILCQLNLHGDGIISKVNIGGSEIVDGRLLAALRVLFASSKETVQNHDLQTLTVLSEKAPLGISIETAALRVIIALCFIALEHFPTKISQDEALLKGCISSSMQLSVKFRMQKKLMIVDVIRKLSMRIKALSKDLSSA